MSLLLTLYIFHTFFFMFLLLTLRMYLFAGKSSDLKKKVVLVGGKLYMDMFLILLKLVFQNPVLLYPQRYYEDVMMVTSEERTFMSPI